MIERCEKLLRRILHRGSYPPRRWGLFSDAYEYIRLREAEPGYTLLDDPVGSGLYDLVGDHADYATLAEALEFAALGCNMVALYLSGCESQLVRNYRLAVEYLRADHREYMLMAPGILYWEPERDRLVSEFTIAPVVLPKTAALWDLWLPDHCHGYTVTFAGLARKVSLGGRPMEEWEPILVVACHHFEHGDPEEYQKIYLVLETASMEAFGERMGWGVIAETLWISGAAEWFVALLRRSGENGYNFRTPGQAIRRFTPIVRAQLQFVPPSFLGMFLGGVLGGVG